MLRRGAFTLIELLIVVAIISILSAVAIPNFLAARVRAKVSRAQAELQTLGTALMGYHVDWGEFPVYYLADWDDIDNPPPYPEFGNADLNRWSCGY